MCMELFNLLKLCPISSVISAQKTVLKHKNKAKKHRLRFPPWKKKKTISLQASHTLRVRGLMLLRVDVLLFCSDNLFNS